MRVDACESWLGACLGPQRASEAPGETHLFEGSRRVPGKIWIFAFLSIHNKEELLIVADH